MPRMYKKKLGSSAYKQYTDEQLEEAVSQINSDKLSIRQASKKYGIPKSSISYLLKNRTSKNEHGNRALTSVMETELVKVLKIASDWGYPLETLDVRLLVQKYLNCNKYRIKAFNDNLPGHDWFYGFLKRHKNELSMKKSQNIKRSRAEVDAQQIDEYFTQLEKSMEGVQPNNIINYDETNLTDDPGAVRVISRRNAKHADRVIDATKSSTSVMFSGTATGVNLPPYVVYKATHLYDTWTENGPPGTIYNRSPSGWFVLNLFEDYFFRVVMPYFKKSPQSEPKLMLGDNCASHLSVNVITACIDNNIRFAFLPPNSTHLTQPLDVAWFRPFKTKWRIVLKKWKLKNNGVIPKAIFPSLLRKTMEDLGDNARTNLVSGFKACGIYPLNANEVLKRLPDSINNKQPKVPFADVLIQTFKETRQKGDRNVVRKRQALKIKPGQSVSEQETLQILKVQNIKKEKIEKKKEVKPKKDRNKKLKCKENQKEDSTNKENLYEAPKAPKRRLPRPVPPSNPAKKVKLII